MNFFKNLIKIINFYALIFIYFILINYYIVIVWLYFDLDLISKILNRSLLYFNEPFGSENLTQKTKRKVQKLPSK